MTTLEGYGQTDKGYARANNEDVLVINTAAGFSLVADGMGGAAAGELAARIFADTTIQVFNCRPHRSETEAVDNIQQAFQQANQNIIEHVTSHPERKGMGCTAELAAFWDTRFAIGHMGDSRTYRFRQGILHQLTRDHSLVQEQIDRGIITPDEARGHALRHVIQRAVGVNERPALDLLVGSSESGDLYLLCTDGLTDMLVDQRIGQILAAPSALEQKTNALVKAALQAGGRDNVTVVIIAVH